VADVLRHAARVRDVIRRDEGNLQNTTPVAGRSRIGDPDTLRHNRSPTHQRASATR
jgi:hypothetical protein